VRLAVVETIVEEHGVEPLLLRVRNVDHKGRLRTGQALNHRVHIGVEESASVLSAGAYTTTLYGMVDRVKEKWRAPPTLTTLG
jgi:hypothetical protein